MKDPAAYEWKGGAWVKSRRGCCCCVIRESRSALSPSFFGDKIESLQVLTQDRARQIFCHGVRWILGTKDFVDGYVARPYPLLNPKQGRIQVPNFGNAKSLGYPDGGGGICPEEQGSLESKIGCNAP